jgi:hypothetical protein
MSDLKKVIISWEDSCSVDTWTHNEDIVMKAGSITTIGYLVREDDRLYCVWFSLRYQSVLRTDVHT